jgi:anti-sigma regulatory factor (Ser/Thr protein kinase)
MAGEVSQGDAGRNRRTPGSCRLTIGGVTEREATLSFAADPVGAADARRFTRGCCTEWGIDDVLDTATLLVSEVVTNAVLHGASTVELTLRAGPGSLRVEVRDDNEALPVRKRYSQTAATGRGLVLLEALSSAWGAEPESAGKVVWFDLDLHVDVDVDHGDASVLAAGAVDDTASGDERRIHEATSSLERSYREAPGGAEASMAKVAGR